MSAYMSGDWYNRAKAAISEGFCPEHKHPLGEAGWCPDCGEDGAWWYWNPQTQCVGTRYRLPWELSGWRP